MTRIHQTWDLGDGELSLDLSLPRPLPADAYGTLEKLAAQLDIAVKRLRDQVGAS